jgi:hypothetical protein
VSQRVIIVWLYNNTGKSVFATALSHAMMNLTWQLFPVNGSFYDPRITGLIVTVVAFIVIFGWGAKQRHTMAILDNNAGKSLFAMALLHWTFGLFWML